MLLTLAPVVVGLLPFVANAKVHKLKLQKLTPAPSNPQLEGSWLAEKYGAPAQPQTPLMGAGGAGRRIGEQNGEPLFWTQEEQAQDGHHVPLTSQSNAHTSATFD
jgi:saccharopepsin